MTPETTVREALAVLLAAPEAKAVVVDDRAEPMGMVTLETIADALRRTSALAPAPAGEAG